MRRFMQLAAAAAGLFLFSSTPALAVPITLTLGGTLGTIDSGLVGPLGLSSSDALSYTITFDPAAVSDSNAGATFGVYRYTGSATWSMTLGSYLASGADAIVQITNSTPDEFSVSANS